MKSLITFIITVVFSAVCVAQNGINYKAVIKDGSGNIVANDLIAVQFTIRSVSETGSVVYQEDHTPTTNANGLIVVNIGEGNTSDDFSAIDWGSDAHFLNVQVNTGGGLIDMGTTQFMAVPYALSAANLTGLETIDEGNGLGWRLKGRDPQNYGDIGENAIDVSYSYSNSGTNGATGNNSTAMGFGASASGLSSTAMGASTTASGTTSTAMGVNSTASGRNSTAMGTYTEASGELSTAMVNRTTAASYSSLAMGRYNIGGGNSTNWVVTDPLVEVGNGTSNSNRSNALTILKNGTITAPSFDMTEITDDKALITKEYAEQNLASSGLEAIDEDNGVGWRIKGRDPQNYGDIGVGAIDLSYSYPNSGTNGATGNSSIAMGYNTEASGGNSTAMGNGTEASGYYSTAMGHYTVASGYYSTAMGVDTKASGYNSTAMGYNTEASGVTSTAMGNGTEASGYYSTAMGYNTKAASYNSLAIGRNNVGGGDPDSWVATDPLFEVGNGISSSDSNALTILKNGKVGIGTANPNTPLQVTGGSDARVEDGYGYLVIGEETGINVVFDENEIIARDNGATSILYLQKDGGDLSVGGSVVHSSDRRLKKNISDLPYGLKEVLQLNPKAYNWKNRKQGHKSLGLIAQEVHPIIGEVVSTANDEAKTLGISYTELIPVLINAIKEQQEIIKSQKGEIQATNENYQALLSRVESLEASLSN